MKPKLLGIASAAKQSPGQLNEAYIGTSTLTCPHCGLQHQEIMPLNTCLFFYTCSGCEEVIRPKQGDCCVFCSYGSVRCPSKQMELDGR